MFLCSGTTGLTTWPSALFLSEFIYQNTHLFSNKNVIELGCGAGLVGLLWNKVCRSGNENYYFTDVNDQVLESVKTNIAINKLGHILNDNDDGCYSSNHRQKTGIDNNDINIMVECLDWFTVSQEKLQSYKVDIILATDVIFDVVLVPPFVKVLKELLQ
eukprot:Pgem_evm1s11651